MLAQAVERRLTEVDNDSRTLASQTIRVQPVTTQQTLHDFSGVRADTRLNTSNAGKTENVC
jgi:hypothetical protein